MGPYTQLPCTQALGRAPSSCLDHKALLNTSQQSKPVWMVPIAQDVQTEDEEKRVCPTASWRPSRGWNPTRATLNYQAPVQSFLLLLHNLC